VLPGLDCGIVRFQASPPDAPLGELRALVFDSWEPEAIAGQGLLAIADDGNDGGPLCLDSRGGGAPEGWPVVLWDHDWQQVTATLYSSAERMLACVIHWLQEGRVAGLATIDPGFGEDSLLRAWPRSTLPKEGSPQCSSTCSASTSQTATGHRPTCLPRSCAMYVR
jgi:hypothetical protein